MTKEKCIADLKWSMGLYLFDPSTGEALKPEQMNEDNRMTYEAMKAAVEFLQRQTDAGDKVEKTSALPFIAHAAQEIAKIGCFTFLAATFKHWWIILLYLLVQSSLTISQTRGEHPNE